MIFLYLEALDRDVKKEQENPVWVLFYAVLKMKMLLNIQLVKICLKQ